MSKVIIAVLVLLFVIVFLLVFSIFILTLSLLLFGRKKKRRGTPPAEVRGD